MVTDRLGRRSRFERSPRGKRLRLTPRDQEILSWLYRYRYLRQDQLVQIFAPQSEKRFSERLGDLFHETGFINRPQLQEALFDAHATPMLYEISDKGVAYLDAAGGLPHRAVTFSGRHRDAFSAQFLHTAMIIDTLLKTELLARSQPGQRFVPVDEIIRRAPQTTQEAKNPLAVPIMLGGRSTQVIPDALYGLEYDEGGKKGYRFWALECERTSPASRSQSFASNTAKKRKAYAALFATRAFQAHWGIPNFKVRLINHQGAEEILPHEAALG